MAMMSARSEAYGVSHLTPVLTNPQRQHSPFPELPISMATSHFDEIDLDWSPREKRFCAGAFLAINLGEGVDPAGNFR